MLIFLLCVAAVVASVSGSGYVEDREYHYKYFGNVAADFSGLSDQSSAVAFVTDIIIQPHTDYWIIKMDNPRYDQANDDIDDVDWHDFEYKRLPSVASEHISKPFQVTFQKGQVKSYKVSKDEPEWSVNVKRGLLSMLNLNFNQENSFQTGEEKNLHKPHPNANYYKVMEDGVTGECETMYIITVEPWELTPYHNNVLNVSKVRNYHNCLHLPLWEYDSISGYDCHECGHEDKPEAHHANAEYHYTLRGDRHNYVIEFAYTLGDVIYNPYREQSVGVRTNRTLELMEESEKHEEIHLEDNLVTHHTLIYRMPEKKEFKKQVDLKKAHYLYDIYSYKASVQEIEKLFLNLVKVYDLPDSYITKMNKKHIPEKFLDLVRAVSTVGYDELEELYKNNHLADIPVKGANEDQRLKRQLFVDTLTMTGTNPAFLLAKKLIQSKSLPEYLVKYLLQTLPYHIKEVSESLLDEYYRLCEHKEVKDCDALHTTCHLGFSSLVYDACVSDYHESNSVNVDKSRCTPEIATKYFTYLTSAINHDTSDKHKISYMRALSNFGIKEVADYLEPYLHDKHNYPVYHRVSAVWALHKVLATHPEKVIPLLFPIYWDTTDDHEVRIAAFTLLMASDLSLYQVELIARNIVDEENYQVRCYVESTLHHLSQSNHPCHRKIANMIKKTDYFSNEWTHHMGNSYNYYSSGFVDSFDHGGFTHIAVIASNNSYVPRSGYLRVNDYLYGESLDTFAVGFHAHGVEKYLDNIFGPKGVFQGKSSLDLLRTRTSRDAQQVKMEVENINKKLNIETRQYEPLQGDVFIQLFGNNFELFQFDEETFAAFFQGKTDSPVEDLNEVDGIIHEHFTLPMDKLYVFPNEAGMPIVLDYKVPIFMHLKNNEISHDFKNGKIDLKMDAHFIMDREHFLTLSVLMPYNHKQIGAGFHRRSMLSLPIKAELSLFFNQKTPELNFKWHPVAPHQIYHHHFDPFTFSSDYSSHKNIVSQDYKPLYKKEDLMKTEHHLFHDYLGLGIDVKAKYHNTWNDRTSWKEFIDENDFREILYYFVSNPYLQTYTFDLTLTPDDQEPTNEVDVEWRYEFYDVQDDDPHLVEYLPDDILEDDVKPHREIKTHNHVLRGEIVAKGPKERKVHGEIAYTHTPDYLYNKLNIYYERSPFHHDETEDFKIYVLGAANYPKHDYKKLYKLETSELDHSLNTSLHIYFGNKGRDHQIIIKGHHTRTEEQEEFDKVRASEDENNNYAIWYRNCKAARDEGRFYDYDCIKYLEETSQLLNHVWEIEYKDIPIAMRNCTYKISQKIKHQYFDYMEEDPYHSHVTDGKIRIEANFSVEDSTLDVRVFKPYETTFYTKLYRDYESISLPYSTFPVLDFTSLEQVLKYDDYPDCLLEVDSLNTFDNYNLELPSIDCFKVISKDCSPHEYFTILGKKIEHSQYSKALKVYLDKWKIEVFPVTGDDHLKVQVNGKDVPVTESDDYVESDHGQDMFHLKFNGAFYSLHSDKYGLIVHYDGRAILVKASAFYRGKLCGLCGDFNHINNNELRGPENCLYPNETTFSYSYAIEEDDCHVPKAEHVCIPEHVEGCTVLRNRMVQISQNNVPHVCFSTHPVPKCAPGCEEEKHVTKKIPFHCLPASDSFTNYLRKESVRRVLHEVKTKSADHHADVDYPERCDKSDH